MKRALAYFAIYVLWGGAYLAIGVLVRELPPFLVAGLRYSMAAVAAAAILAGAKTERPSRRQVINAAWTGVVLLSIAYGIIFWAAQRLPSWVVAVLMSTAFLWSYVGESLVLKAYPFRLRVLPPVFCGIFAIPLLVGVGIHNQPFPMIPALCVLLCALCWSFGSLATKYVDMPQSCLRTAQIQLAVSGLVLLSASGLLGEWKRVGPLSEVLNWQSMAAMVFLVFGASIGAMTAFHWLLARERASMIATSAFVNPAVATAIGIVLGHERAAPLQLAGAGCMIVSILAIWRMQSQPAPRGGLDANALAQT